MGRRIGTGVGIGREVGADEEDTTGIFLTSESRSTIGFVVEGGADDEGEGKEEGAGEAGFLATTSRGFGLSLRWAFC